MMLRSLAPLAPLAALVLAAAIICPRGAVAQHPTLVRHAPPGEPTAALFQQAGAGEKSPALAGILSFLIPFGTGSFYAGHNPHGVRHLVIGGVTFVGASIGFFAACDTRLDICDQDDPGFIMGGILGAAYAVNWIWGTVVAVNDANAFNRRVRGAALDFRPGVEVLTASVSPALAGHPDVAATRLGFRVVRFAF